jgi:hypothetical protein
MNDDSDLFLAVVRRELTPERAAEISMQRRDKALSVERRIMTALFVVGTVIISIVVDSCIGLKLP